MADLLEFISSGDAHALKSMSSRLFERHGPFANWAAAWWATVIHEIQSSTPDAQQQSVVLSHIIEVDDQAGKVLDSVIQSWLDGMTIQARIDLLAQKSAGTISALLTGLAAERRIEVVTLLEKLVYPIWKHAAPSCMTGKGRLPAKVSQAVEATIIISQQLLLVSPPYKHLAPVDLRQALILQAARAKVFDQSNVQSLIRHLPFLVILGAAKGNSAKAQEQMRPLLETLAMLPDFKAAAFRHLDPLKDAFLSNEWSKASMEPGLEASMVNALKLIMADGPPGKVYQCHMVAAADAGNRLFPAFEQYCVPQIGVPF